MILNPLTPAAHSLPYIQFQRRPSPRPSIPVALGARSVIWGQFLPGEYEDATVRPWVKLLWSVAGVGKVCIDGQILPLPPEHIALFLPGMKHEAWAETQSSGEIRWELRWLTMDGPLCAEIVRSLGLNSAGVWHSGPAPIEAFDQLGNAISASVTPEGERLADAAAYALLIHAANSRKAPALSDGVVERALHLIAEKWSFADWGVEQLAREVGLHRSAFSRRFTMATGLSPSEYVANLRMQSALSLLRSTRLSVQVIAQQCGFTDPDYFTRHFRRRQGITPTEYRQDRG